MPYYLPIQWTAWLWTIFDHPSYTSMSRGGQKKLIFRVKIRQLGVLGQASSRASPRTGQFQGKKSTWKPFHVLYHIPIYGTAWLWTIFDHASHLSAGPGGGQCSPLQAFDWYYSGIATDTKNEKKNHHAKELNCRLFYQNMDVFLKKTPPHEKEIKSNCQSESRCWNFLCKP